MRKNNIKNLQLKIADNKTILGWSCGEVTKAETINYKTNLPEEDGLFSQRIFGPINNYECACGKYKGYRYDGLICEKCGTKVTNSNIRRERMGHIHLPFPIVHTWYINESPSISKLSLILNFTTDKIINEVVYFKSYIIIDNAGYSKYFKNKSLFNLDERYAESTGNRNILIKFLKEILIPSFEKDSIQETVANEYIETLNSGAFTFDIDGIVEFVNTYSKVRIGIGSEAIYELVKQINLDKEISLIKEKQAEKKAVDYDKVRLKILYAFKNSGNSLESLFLTDVPVTPPDTRPFIRLQNGNYSTSEINELYRKIIMRVSTLNELIDFDSPLRLIYEQKCNLQVAVDNLFDSSSQISNNQNQDTSPKSLTEYLKGKTGLYRQNLLGKRVDFSGRSAIVSGPDLKLYEIGMPIDMILKIFEPFICYELTKKVDNNPVCETVAQAKALITARADEIWPFVYKVVKERPVLMNRAPTLHKLGFQAFEIKPTNEKAIKFPSLACTGFNADFDGDTMALHIPLSDDAINEARAIMMTTNNIIAPKDGKPAIAPTQDVVLGIYYLTCAKLSEPGQALIFSSFNEIQKAFTNKVVSIHSIIAISTNELVNKKLPANMLLITTVGRILFNSTIPNGFAFRKAIDVVPTSTDVQKFIENLDISKHAEGVKKGETSSLISEVFATTKDSYIASKMADKIKTLGFKYATKSGYSFSCFEFPIYQNKKTYIEEANEKISIIRKKHQEGFLTENERYRCSIDIWTKVNEKVTADMNKIITNPQNLFNPIIQLNKSGARGNLSQYTQMLGMRGLMVRSYNYSLASKNSGAVVKDIIEQPVLNSFVEGLNISDFFNSAYGARKSMVDLALKTSKSGYMTRKLVDSAQDVIITTDDCGTEEGVFLTPIKNAEGQIIVKLSELIAGRYASADVVHNSETFVKNGELITQEIAKKIEAAGVKGVEIFSPIKCKCKHGICKKCYGIDLATNEPVKLHTAVGVIAAQSLGEPVTQLNMNSKHSGGVASGGQISQGYERIKQLFDIVEPKEHELAVLTEYDGKVTSITLTGSFNQVNVSYDNGINKVFNIPSNLKLNYEVDSTFKAGSALSHGSLSLKQALAINGVPFVVDYLIEEVQRVYRSQGIEINTKYLEIITKKIIENMFVTSTGDSEDVYLGQHIKIADLYEKNKILFDRKKQPITAAFQLTGLDKIPAFSYSFLSAASFQYTKKILINSAINGEIDELKSLNENVILGKLIPAGTGKMEDKISLKEIADDICKNKEY